jgi:hypothetical protein
MLKTLKTATLPHSRRDFLGLAFRAQQLRRQLPRRACRPARKDPQQVCPLFEGGEAAQGVVGGITRFGK